jgi:Protein tyrosine phosphatase-like protein, PTPLA
MLSWSAPVDQLHQQAVAVCVSRLASATIIALSFSFLEVVNAAMGLTRSKPHQAGLFAVVRIGVELWIAPILGPLERAHPLHLLTVLCWSIGDTIRFGCFAIDQISSEDSATSNYVRSIRYTVGPALFPLGALAEMAMVIAAGRFRQLLAASQGSDGRSFLWFYGAACLWPAGFFPLMAQLLKQRRRFFERQRNREKSE